MCFVCNGFLNGTPVGKFQVSRRKEGEGKCLISCTHFFERVHRDIPGFFVGETPVINRLGTKTALDNNRGRLFRKKSFLYQ